MERRRCAILDTKMDGNHSARRGTNHDVRTHVDRLRRPTDTHRSHVVVRPPTSNFLSAVELLRQDQSHELVGKHEL